MKHHNDKHRGPDCHVSREQQIFAFEGKFANNFLFAQLPCPSKKEEDMNSNATPRVLDTLKEEQSMGRSDLDNQTQVGSSDAIAQPQKLAQDHDGSSSNLDITAYDLQAHTLLCAELLNGEGIDRLPQESDAELTARLWSAWNNCKFANQ